MSRSVSPIVPRAQTSCYPTGCFFSSVHLLTCHLSYQTQGKPRLSKKPPCLPAGTELSVLGFHSLYTGEPELYYTATSPVKYKLSDTKNLVTGRALDLRAKCAVCQHHLSTNTIVVLGFPRHTHFVSPCPRPCSSCWAFISSHFLVTCVFKYYSTSTTHFLSRTSPKNSQHVCWSLYSTENPSLASTAEFSKPLLYLSRHLLEIYFPKALESVKLFSHI